MGIDPETNYVDDNLHYYVRDFYGEVSEISKEVYHTVVDELDNNGNMSYLWVEEYSYSEMLEILKDN